MVYKPHFSAGYSFLQVSLKIEDKGLKASRDSDQTVRDAYFKAADRASEITHKGHDKAHRGKVRGFVPCCPSLLAFAGRFLVELVGAYASVYNF